MAGLTLGRQSPMPVGCWSKLAWITGYPDRVGETLRARLEGLPKAVRDIARKALNPVVRPISPTERRRQEAAGRSGGTAAADSRLPVGDRREGARISGAAPYRCCTASGAEPLCGELGRQLCVGLRPDRLSCRPRKPETKTRKAVPNPRIRA